MMDELERRLLRLEQRFGAQPDLRMGVVHSVAPLKVVVDGDPSNTPVPASSMVLDLTPGERVQCIWVGGTVRVLSARRYGTLRGTTADMTLLDTSGIAVEGMRFFNITDNREYVYAGGAWKSVNWTVVASQTSGSQSFSAETALAGLSLTVTLAIAQRVRIDLTFRRYSTFAGDLVNFSVKNNGTQIWDDTAPANSGGAASGLSTTHTTFMTLGAGTNTLTAHLRRVAGSGTIVVTPNVAAPNTLAVTAS